MANEVIKDKFLFINSKSAVWVLLSSLIRREMRQLWMTCF